VLVVEDDFAFARYLYELAHEKGFKALVTSRGAAALALHTTDLMQVAMQLYERMGFIRAPDLDFHPVPEVTIKGYRFNLEAEDIHHD